MENSTDWIDIAMIVTYVLLGVPLVGLVFFSLKQIVTNPKRSKTALFGLIGLGIIFAAAMGLSSGTDVPEALFEKTETNYELSRLIGAGLISVYLISICVIVTLVTSEVLRPLKK